MSNQDVLDKLKTLFSKGLTGREIARELGMSPPWVSTKLKSLGLKANNYTSSTTKQSIRDMYASGIQVQEIVKTLNVDKQMVHKYAKGLPKLGNQKHTIDHSFLDRIGKQQAYFIGFFLADGHLSVKYNRYVFGLSKKDLDLLELFKEWLKTDYPIRESISLGFNSSTPMAILAVISKNMAAKGIEMNLHLNKCTELSKFPSQVETPELFPYALKGFIDGDGWISKDSHGRDAMEIISNPMIVAYLKNYLEVNYGIGSSIKKEKRTKVPMEVIRFFGDNFRKVFALITKDPIGLQRKIKR